jgi:hypothetical protein
VLIFLETNPTIPDFTTPNLAYSAKEFAELGVCGFGIVGLVKSVKSTNLGLRK